MLTVDTVIGGNGRDAMLSAVMGSSHVRELAPIQCLKEKDQAVQGLVTLQKSPHARSKNAQVKSLACFMIQGMHGSQET